LGNHNIVETNDIVLSNNSINHLTTRNWASKINKFQVLCVYNQEKNSLNPLSKMKANTFIIWEQAYQENEELFIKLRLAARNEQILRIGENIVGYLIKKYEDHLGMPIKNHSKLKDKYFIDQLLQKFDTILKRDTFLGDNAIWEDFCEWFRIHLTDWILDQLR